MSEPVVELDSAHCLGQFRPRGRLASRVAILAVIAVAVGACGATSPQDGATPSEPAAGASKRFVLYYAADVRTEDVEDQLGAHQVELAPRLRDLHFKLASVDNENRAVLLEFYEPTTRFREVGDLIFPAVHWQCFMRQPVTEPNIIDAQPLSRRLAKGQLCI